MNSPIRRLAAVITVLFAALFLSVTYIQVVQADSLEKKPNNLRTLVKDRSRHRGDILVGNKAVASSVASNDVYQWVRKYADGPMYAPVTGYYSLVNGAHGLEAAENGYLAGTSDELFVRNLKSMLTGEETQAPPCRPRSTPRPRRRPTTRWAPSGAR